MGSYIGRHAELYDLFYADKDYAGEAAFASECLKTHSQGGARELLELACGTGRHALELEKRGHHVVAVDHSEDMLRHARTNAAKAGSGIDFLHQDMRKLEVKSREFDAVVCLFDSIGYVRSNSAIASVMQGVHRHLRAGGLFLFEFWHAAAMLRHYEPVRLRLWETADGEILRVARTTLEVASQTATVAYTIYELRKNGSHAEIKETQTNRYFLVQEMALQLSANGFQALEWFAGFSASAPITEDTWHILALARKVSSGVGPFTT